MNDPYQYFLKTFIDPQRSADVANTECICSAIMGIPRNELQKIHVLGQVYFDEGRGIWVWLYNR